MFLKKNKNYLHSGQTFSKLSCFREEISFEICRLYETSLEMVSLQLNSRASLKKRLEICVSQFNA